MKALPLDKLSLDDREEAQEQPSTSSSSQSKSKRSGTARRKLKKERRERLPKLPQELIGHILNLAYPRPTSTALFVREGRDRFVHLARAALVFRE